MGYRKTKVHDKLFASKLKDREYDIETLVRHEIKTRLEEFLSFTFDGNYFFKLDPEKYDKIFKTEKLQRSGITYDERYTLKKLKEK